MPGPITAGVQGGFQNFFEGLREGQRRRDETEKAIGDAQGADVFAQHLYQTGALSHEDMAKFQQSPLKGKKEMIGEIAAGYALQLRQREDARAEQAAQRAEEERQREINFQPSATTFQVPTGRTTYPFQTQGVPYDPGYGVPETETYTGIRKSPHGDTEIVPPPFQAPATVQPTRAADTGNILGYGLPTSRGAVTYPQHEVTPPEGTPVYNPETGELMGVWSYGRFVPTKAPSQAEQLMNLFNPDQQSGGQTGTAAPPQTTIGPSPVPGQTGVTGAPVVGGKIRVRGPNGQTGTANAGQQLPPGWVQIQ